MNVYSIPPGTPFLDSVARGVLARWRDPADPSALSRATILVPSQQAACALADSFARVSGGAPLILPMIRPVGDPEEDELSFLGEAEDALFLPPALSPLRRRLLLARLIHEWSQRREPPEPMTWGQAARLAASLMHLIDQLLAVRADLSALDDLVPESHAAHWRITLDFLRILREHWPNILAAEGATEPVARHTRLLEEQARRWRGAPPAGPIVAAGFTHPATAALGDLLAMIAGLENGAVVLPGLDRELDEASWLALGPTHPQFGLREILQRIGLGRSEVGSWSDRSGNPVRARLIAEALRPADTTEEWADAVRRLAPLADKALNGLARIDAPGPREEAAAIALILRQSLEEPGRTAALVTPDRALARRVAAELRRWDIAVEDSAGQPLSATAPGIFLRLLASAAQAQFAPASFLALLKHPLASGGLAPGLFAKYVRRLERAVLRGPRPAPGLDGIAAAIEAKRDWELSAWFADLSQRLRPFADFVSRPDIDLGALARAHFEGAAQLAEAPDSPASPLWAGEAGSAVVGFAEDLVQAAAGIGLVDGREYANLFESLIEEIMVPVQGASHPRLCLWDLNEARLRQADLMILAGLNEAVWPPAARADLWLNRPMRAAFGLPAPERRMGLSAHAFTQAACGPRVVLTRARKTDGAPTIASRWLVRLENLLKGLGRENALEASIPWLSWVEGLDEPDRFAPARPPRPCPPRSSRPNRLSITDVELLFRDPYAIYARHVLGLAPLDPIDADPGAAERGVIVHHALEAFVRAYPSDLPEDAFDCLVAIGRDLFDSRAVPPGVAAFWWPRFLRIARWFVETFEAERRRAGKPAALEWQGVWTFDLPEGGPFALVAKADRIDRETDGGLAIFDYKTGRTPSLDQDRASFSPQLPLEALIGARGGFSGLEGPVNRVAYVELTGEELGGKVHEVAEGLPDLLDRTEDGLLRLLARFDDEATPYLSRPRPIFGPYATPYDHLARFGEWGASPESEE